MVGQQHLIGEDGILRRRNIEIAWQNDNEALITAGLGIGDALVTTPLGQVTSGIRVSIVGEQRENFAAGGSERKRPTPEGAK